MRPRFQCLVGKMLIGYPMEGPWPVISATMAVCRGRGEEANATTDSSEGVAHPLPSCSGSPAQGSAWAYSWLHLQQLRRAPRRL